MTSKQGVRSGGRTCRKPISRASCPTACSCAGKMAACFSTTATLTMPAASRKVKCEQRVKAGRAGHALHRQPDPRAVAGSSVPARAPGPTTASRETPAPPDTAQALSRQATPLTRIQHGLQVAPQARQVGRAPHHHRLSCHRSGGLALQRVPRAVPRRVAPRAPACQDWVWAGERAWGCTCPCAVPGRSSAARSSRGTRGQLVEHAPRRASAAPTPRLARSQVRPAGRGRSRPISGTAAAALTWRGRPPGAAPPARPPRPLARRGPPGPGSPGRRCWAGSAACEEDGALTRRAGQARSSEVQRLNIHSTPQL